MTDRSKQPNPWVEKYNLPPLDCGDCQACCKNELIFLMDDEVGKYKSEIVGGRHALPNRPNGDCFYLTPAGCGIHAQKPLKCWELDCRGLLLKVGLKAFLNLRISDEMKEVAQQKLKEI